MHSFPATLASESTALHALVCRRTRRLGINPSKRFRGIRVDPSRRLAGRCGSLQHGDIPRLYHLAAMRMRFASPIALATLLLTAGFVMARYCEGSSSHINAESVTSPGGSSVVFFLHQSIVEKLRPNPQSSSPSTTDPRFVIYPSTRKQHRPAMDIADRMPPLVVSSVAIVGIIWVIMVLGIRLYLRCKLNGPVGNDDYAAILATGLGIAQSALVLASVHSGLGKNQSSLWDEFVDDEQHIVKVSPHFLATDRTKQTKHTRTYTRLTEICSVDSSAMQRLYCISQQPGSLELRAAYCTYASHQRAHTSSQLSRV